MKEGGSNAALALLKLGFESRRLMAEQLAGLNLRPPQFGLLNLLANAPATSQQWLAERLQVDRANLVELLDDLEQRDLLERVADPADRRRHVLRITDEGRRVARQARRAAEIAEDRLLEGLTAEERERLRAVLAKLSRCRWAGPEDPAQAGLQARVSKEAIPG